MDENQIWAIWVMAKNKNEKNIIKRNKEKNKANSLTPKNVKVSCKKVKL